MPYEVRWRVLSRMSLAVLDHRWLAMASRWPPIIDSLLARVTERSHALALSVGIHTLRHVRTRLLVLFWHMADRFGKVTPDGVVLDVPLRHSDLAQLTGATRPSVSDALS